VRQKKKVALNFFFDEDESQKKFCDRGCEKKISRKISRNSFSHQLWVQYYKTHG